VDGLGRLIRVDEPDSFNNLGTIGSAVQPTLYTYDPLGNLTGVTQGQQTRTFSYDSLSRLATAKNPEQGNNSGVQVATADQYDPNGNLLSKTNPNGSSVTYTYDGLNRVKQKALSSGGVFVYSYDTITPNGKGRLASVVQQGSSDGYYYDSFDVVYSAQKLSK